MLRAAALAGCLVLATGEARAYDFQIHAGTAGQAYQLPTLHLLGAEIWLARRRLTQTLSLTVWDLGDLRRKRLRAQRGLRDDGPIVWMTAYLRLDHDFGAWTMGAVRVDGATLDALDEVPELAASSVDLELLYGELAVDNLWHRVDLRFGRLLHLDEVDPWAMDGVSARVRPGGPLALEAMAGLRVRDSSPLGGSAVELDGTSGADCREYVEGATPGTGTWQIIDRSRVPNDDPLASDLAYCPEREALMPMAGVAVETTAIHGTRARLSYRRAASATPGLIGPVDRLDHPDTGLYPDELGQAPAWGVNEELVAASLDGRWRVGGARGLTIAPWARGRYSLVDAAVADASAGLRLEHGPHALEPEIAYARPLLDADSIWSVFVTGASTDLRLDYQLSPRRGPVRASATAWARRYGLPDPGDGGGSAAASPWVGGGTVRASLAVTPRLRTELELLGDDGYGGRRLGATASGRWQARRDLLVTGRLGGLDVTTDPDLRPSTRGASGVAQVGARWAIDGGFGLDAAGEVSTSPWAGAQVRVYLQLDVELEPEHD
ncbi:MAG TPA: hypothetical protein VHE35_16915 [Kofleriaceae bacterium]|nr:hypothetical protein [Kofleriaceae bacterium]